MSASSTLPARLAPSSRSMRLGVTLKRSEKKRSGRLCVISVIDSPDWPFGASNPNAPLTPPQAFQTTVHCIETGKDDRCAEAGSGERGQERGRRLQIRRVEALRKPAVDVGQGLPGLVTQPSPLKEAGKAHRRAQLE